MQARLPCIIKEDARRKEKTFLRELINATMKNLLETDDDGLDKPLKREFW